jgi:hypothetical protein
MRAGCRPINRDGYRNALCPYYRDCLDQAVRKAWEYWDCAECIHRNSTDPEFEIEGTLSHNVTYFDLPMEIAFKM